MAFASNSRGFAGGISAFHERRGEAFEGDSRVNATTMPCPVCQVPMTLDPVSLLAGQKARCDTCGTALLLEPGETMRSTIERFEAAREEVQQVIGGRKKRRS